MKPKTEEFLYLLLWTADTLARPTFRKAGDSFESWAYRNGFLRQLQILERRQFLESQAASSSDGPHPRDRLYRLTEKGRLHALGGRDPMARWNRKWDGQWRLVLFDIPGRENAVRMRLRRQLQSQGFGYLQDSVWVSPDPLRQTDELASADATNVEHLILLEARPCAGESDAQIVAGAWDFEAINLRYRQHLKILQRCPAVGSWDENVAKALRRWGAEERESWLAAVSSDPLLPNRLHPSDYAGVDCWNRRVETLTRVGEHLRHFHP